MEPKRQLTITRQQDHELNPAQLMLRRSKLVREAQEEKQRKEMEMQKEAEAEVVKESSSNTSAPPKVADHGDMCDSMLDTMITLSVDMEAKRSWVKKWAVKAASVYLNLLLEQEIKDLKKNGKLDLTAVASKLGMRYQSLYQLMYREFSPRLETLAGIAAVLGYAVEPRFIPIEEAVEHEAFRNNLTLGGTVDSESKDSVDAVKAVFAEIRESERIAREKILKQRQDEYRKANDGEPIPDNVVAMDSSLPLGDQLKNCMATLRHLNGFSNYQIAIKSNTCKATVGRVSKGELSVSLAAIGKVMSAFPRYTLQLSVVEVEGAQATEDDDDETDSIYKVLADTDIDPEDADANEDVSEDTDAEAIVTYEKIRRY